MLFRAIFRVPWQVSAAAGWTGLLLAPQFAEVWERDSPMGAAASSSASRTAPALNVAAIEHLKTEGFVVGPPLHIACAPYPPLASLALLIRRASPLPQSMGSSRMRCCSLLAASARAC